MGRGEYIPLDQKDQDWERGPSVRKAGDQE